MSIHLSQSMTVNHVSALALLRQLRLLYQATRLDRHFDWIDATGRACQAKPASSLYMLLLYSPATSETTYSTYTQSPKLPGKELRLQHIKLELSKTCNLNPRASVKSSDVSSSDCSVHTSTIVLSSCQSRLH